jgi:hypothetical protein
VGRVPLLLHGMCAAAWHVRCCMACALVHGMCAAAWHVRWCMACALVYAA